jgi:hypothetical protein
MQSESINSENKVSKDNRHQLSNLKIAKQLSITSDNCELTPEEANHLLSVMIRAKVNVKHQSK